MDATTWQGTVLLADVRRDAAVLYAKVGAARALAAVRDCVEALAHTARTRGGNVVRAMGDEVVALFPTAGGAADAAVAMQAAYRKRLRPMPRSEDHEVTSCEFVWQVGDITRKLEHTRRAPAQAKVHLRLKYGATELSTAQAQLASVRVGRDLGCDLFIPEPLASRHHCTLERRGGAYVLRDHSTNGSFVTEEGGEEIRVLFDEALLGRHGWLSFGQPRAHSEHVVEYFCE